jgi:APA family basic amino acid/polyamine antiporter
LGRFRRALILWALAYAELGTMMPETGGQYVHTREAYNPFCAFVCGWTFILAVVAGGTVFLAVSFALYVGNFAHLTPLASKLIAISLVLRLSAVNYIGVQEAVWLQRVFTSLKIGGLLLLVGSAFRLSAISPVFSGSTHSAVSPSHFGAAMLACWMAYNGWLYITFVAGEIREPGRSLPRALTLAMAAVIAIYLITNLAYLRMLSTHEIAGSDRIGATLATRTLAAGGAAILSIIVLFPLLVPSTVAS